MTTKVATTVVCTNVHRAMISVHDKQPDGTWLKNPGVMVEIGQTVFHDGYITDTRRIVIEEVPLKSVA